jgi:hypothetical protein
MTTSDPLPRTLTLALDGQGGADLRAHAGLMAARLDSPGLRILTLADCPDLVHLDRTACAALRWIAVTGCPALRSLALPPSGPGPDVHVDFGAASPVLDISGAAGDFDCCWDGGTAAMPRAAARGTVLDGVHVGPFRSATLSRAGLVVLIGAAEAVTSLIVPTEGAMRALVVDGCAALAGVQLGNLRAAKLHNLPVLARVAASGIDTLRVTSCPEIRRVDGHGTTLTVVDSAVHGLEVRGPWHGLTCRGVGANAVIAPLVGTLDLPGATRGEQAEPLLRTMAAAAAAGDTKARDSLLAWCRRVRTPHGVLGALQVLALLLSAGVQPRLLWDIREALRNRQGEAHSSWHWKLPEDLGQRGWDADLRLWLACPELPGSALEAGEPAEWKPVHLATLVGGLRDFADRPEEKRLLSVLRRALRTSSSHFRRKAARGLSALDRDRLRRVMQGLVALRHHAFCPRLVAAFCAWLNRTLKGEARLDLLGAMHLLGAQAATEALIRLATKCGLSAAERDRALAHAFAPARSSHLCFAEAAHG